MAAPRAAFVVGEGVEIPKSVRGPVMPIFIINPQDLPGGGGGGGGGATKIDDLLDVIAGDAIEGDLLRYTETDGGLWVLFRPTLDSLDGVDTSGVGEGDVLQFVGGQWQPVTIPTPPVLPDAIYHKWDVDAPPEVPHVYDDEFDDGELGASWHEWDTANYVTIAEGPLGLTITSNGVGPYAGIDRLAPVGDFAAVVKVGIAGKPVNYSSFMFGFAQNSIANPTTADIVGLIIEYANSGAVTLIVRSINDIAESGYADTKVVFNQPPTSFYLRLRQIGTDWLFDFSLDGIAFLNAATIARPFAATRLAILGRADANALPYQAIVRFFRVYSDTSYALPVQGRAIPQGGNGVSIDNIGGVNTQGATEGQVLYFDSGTWKPTFLEDLGGGGGGGGEGGITLALPSAPPVQTSALSDEFNLYQEELDPKWMTSGAFQALALNSAPGFLHMIKNGFVQNAIASIWQAPPARPYTVRGRFYASLPTQYAHGGLYFWQDASNVAIFGFITDTSFRWWGSALGADRYNLPQTTAVSTDQGPYIVEVTIPETVGEAIVVRYSNGGVIWRTLWSGVLNFHPTRIGIALHPNGTQDVNNQLAVDYFRAGAPNSFNDLEENPVGEATEGDLIRFDGNAWQFYRPSLADLEDVNLEGATDGDVLQLVDGEWVPVAGDGNGGTGSDGTGDCFTASGVNVLGDTRLVFPSEYATKEGFSLSDSDTKISTTLPEGFAGWRIRLSGGLSQIRVQQTRTDDTIFNTDLNTIGQWYYFPSNVKTWHAYWQGSWEVEVCEPDYEIGSGLNDEFNGSSLNAKWTVFNGIGTYLSALDVGTARTGHLHLQHISTAVASHRAAGIYQAFAPAGDFEIISKMSYSTEGVDFAYLGLFLGNGAPGAMRYVGFGYWTNSPRLSIANFTSPTNLNVGIRDLLSTLGGTNGYVRIRRVGITMEYAFSADGISWVTAYKENLPFTIASVGILINAYDGKIPPVDGFVDYFRVYQ